VSGEEKTETVYGVENTVSVSLECFARVKERHHSCGDHTLPSVIVTTEPIKNAYRELLRRGIKSRFITEITEKNIEYCKELMEIVHELRHLEGVKGNFAVGESDYIATAIQQEARPIARLIHSNARGMIEQQQYFFETLWSKAIPARQRFKEIEQGAKREFVETIRDPSEIQKIEFDLIKAAEEEILILFSTANAYSRQEKAGTLDLLKESASKRGVKVRILVPVVDDYNKAIIISNSTIQQLKDSGIDIQQIKKEGKLDRLHNELMMLIADQSVCLTVELREDTEEEISEETIGLVATYSNSESTVFAYTSIFEDLSIHTERMGQHDLTRRRTTRKQRHKNASIKTRRTTSIR
jgi:phosphatidylserine/phosphatidylglycerophosphate/cardiolipin synthase-like enzyme